VVFGFCWSVFVSVCQVGIITAGTARFVQELHFFIFLHLCPSQLSEGDCSRPGKAENRLLVSLTPESHFILGTVHLTGGEKVTLTWQTVQQLSDRKQPVTS